MYEGRIRTDEKVTEEEKAETDSLPEEELNRLNKLKVLRLKLCS